MAFEHNNQAAISGQAAGIAVAMIVIGRGFIILAERRLTVWRPKIDVWRR